MLDACQRESCVGHHASGTTCHHHDLKTKNSASILDLHMDRHCSANEATYWVHVGRHVNFTLKVNQ